MPVFGYRALDSRGKSISGTIDADSSGAAKDKLKRLGYFPTDVSEERTKQPTKVKIFGREFVLGEIFGRTRLSDVTIATRQLSTLLEAGIPLIQGLAAVIEQTDSLALKKVLTKIRDRVNEGSSLANALREHPRVFDELYINMVHAGEQSGTLEIVLERLADFLDKKIEIRNKILSTLTYPIIMSVVALGVITFLVGFVIPRVSRIFEGLHQTLPAITVALLTASYFVRDFWWLLIGVIVILYILFRRYLKSEGGRKNFDRLVIKSPVLGKLTLKIAIARFARTLATLLKGGVPMLTSMEIVSAVVNNSLITESIKRSKESLSEGESLAEPLKKAKIFPPLVIHMVAIGEQTGELEDMLLRAAVAYEREVDRAIETLTSLFGPLMILIMGGMVTLIVLSILLPILNMTQGLR